MIMFILEGMGSECRFQLYIFLLLFIEDFSYRLGIQLSDERIEIVIIDFDNRLFMYNFNKVWGIFLIKNEKILRRLWVGYLR